MSLGMSPLWATISDHRPISLWLTRQALKISEIYHRACIIKLNFKDKDEATLAVYRQKVSEAAAGLPPLEDLSSKAAGERLRDYASISVACIPKVATSQLKKKDYRGGWSPVLMALDAKLTMVTSVVHKISGIGKGAWWQSSATQQAGITTQVNEWENKVRTLKWTGGIPPEAWAGLSPEEWRALADEDSPKVLENCLTELLILRKAFQGRRRTEYRRLISYATRLREYQQSIGKLKKAIRSITGTYVESISL